MDMSPVLLMAAASLVFLGAVAHSAVGFGLGVVAAPLLYVIDPRLLPAPMLLAVLLISALNLWTNRTGLALAELGSAFAGRVPGTLLALWLFMHSSDGRVLPFLIAIAVLATIALSLTPMRILPNPRRLFVAGFASGFMGTVTTIGGPMIALLYQHAEGARVRANLAGYLLIGGVMSLAGLALIGRFGLTELALGLWLVPPALLGFAAGSYVTRFLSPGFLRPAILSLSVLAALGVLVDALK